MPAPKGKLIFTPPVDISDNVSIQRRGRYLVVWNKAGHRPKRIAPLKQIKNRLFETEKGIIIEERFYIVEGWKPYEEVSKEKS